LKLPLKLLLTGPGALGEPLLFELARRGHHGRVLRRRREVTLPSGWAGIRFDISDPRRVQDLDEACADRDAIVHLAAVTHTNRRGLYERVNVEGTRHLLAAAARGGVPRFIHVSTRAIDPQGGGYSQSKARAEDLIRAATIPWTILRPAEVYGVGSEGLNALIERVRNGRWVPLIGDGSARLAPVCIEDVVRGFISAIEREPRGETLLLAGPEEMTYRELVDRLGRHFGRRPRVLPIPLPLARLAAALLAVFPRPPLTRDQIPRLLSSKPYDLEPTRTALGFSPRRLEEGLAAGGG
jgi:NADH dehydrogenase